jgi:hypothetical protein
LKQSAIVSKDKIKEKQKQRQMEKRLATQHQQRLGGKDGPPKIVVRKQQLNIRHYCL